MQKSNLKYWLCQILGWGGWAVLNMSLAYLFAQDYYFNSNERQRLFIAGLLIQFIWYVLTTHLLRVGLKKARWINFPINKVIGLFAAGVIIAALVSYYGSRFTAVESGYSLVQFEKKEDFESAVKREKTNNVAGTKYYLGTKNGSDSAGYNVANKIKRYTGWYRDKKGVWQYEEQRQGRFWWDLVFNIILISLWLLIYMVWHYLERNRKDELDKLNLEKTVKEMELKTIKSHINPHFIFNSLNSIRALVDENPSRARTAITELSNILRSSLQVEKLETVPLEKELNIVKDYLALEQMRFEERLKIELDVDDKTLHQPIPPMMLQTLVENAIKHGISKQISGGVVRLIAKNNGDKFELIVENTGVLNEGEEAEEAGFGFKSTRNRLRILFNNKAHFEIKQLTDDIVQARIEMPVLE